MALQDLEPFRGIEIDERESMDFDELSHAGLLHQAWAGLTGRIDGVGGG